MCELKSKASTILRDGRVTPSRVCELKYGRKIDLGKVESVTPSRVCELKWDNYKYYTFFPGGHTLTGV